MTYNLVYNNQALEDIQAHLIKEFHLDISSFHYSFDQLTVHISKDILIHFLMFLKEHALFQFRQLIDICGVDYPDRSTRFDVVYHLLSLKHNIRLRIKVSVNDDEFIPSVTDVYPCANWFEREVWDMFGLFFSEHPDPRRILTDYGFQGHPLRRDFPMSGYVQMRYDELEKRCVYEPVDLTQEYRHFDFMSPWEGKKHILSSDEEKND